MKKSLTFVLPALPFIAMLGGCATNQPLNAVLRGGFDQNQVTQKVVTAKPVTFILPSMPDATFYGLMPLGAKDFVYPGGYMTTAVSHSSDFKVMSLKRCHVLEDQPRHPESCETIESNVAVEHQGGDVRITFTPALMITSQGYEAPPIPSKIKLPAKPLENWHTWMMNQATWGKTYQVKTKLSPQDVKSAFDRNLHAGAIDPARWQNTILASDEKAQQFSGIYGIKINPSVNVRIEAWIYPYRNGSLVKYTIQGRGFYEDTHERNWARIYADAAEHIKHVINE